MTPELVIAISALITGLLSAGGAYINHRRGARKDEVVMLREEVERLQKRVTELERDNDGWRTRYDELYNDLLTSRRENAWLRVVLERNGITVPALPASFNI
jgi:hypothetical protein